MRDVDRPLPILYHLWYGLGAGSRQDWPVVPTHDDAAVIARRRAALGARVRELRQRQGFTQERLAEAAGFDRKSINRLETAAYSPSVDRLFVIAAALGVTASELLTGID
jgi:DNA-binding XRE family transcriptional regulator